VAQALEGIARDEATRARYLEFARDADQPSVRARMIELAHQLGWLSPAEKRAELMRMIGDRIAGGAVTSAEVDLVCPLNKVRALDTLASQSVSDPESLEELARSFPLAESVGVQTAIAGVLIRADYKAIAKPELVQTLQQYRLRSSNGADLIDVLIRRLQAQ